MRVLTWVEAAQLLAQQAGQHGDDSLHQVNAGAPCLCLFIQGTSGPTCSHMPCSHEAFHFDMWLSTATCSPCQAIPNVCNLCLFLQSTPGPCWVMCLQNMAPSCTPHDRYHVTQCLAGVLTLYAGHLTCRASLVCVPAVPQHSLSLMHAVGATIVQHFL